MERGLFMLESLILKIMPSCERCFWAMADSMVVNGDYGRDGLCNRCCNWDQFSDSSANQFDKTANTDYPRKRSSDIPHEYPAKRQATEEYLIC